ncbi:5' nucleotidase, NT5C type [Cohnella yongneupensis]|uniref:5'-3'-deoxyribonucleotidase n=1 Tax=Cohnella yongneupensis TaxID=425006 RepID=A0ABW0QW57_9BACL
MQRIAIDMDEVIAEFSTKHLELFNRTFNEQVTMEELHGKKLRDLRPELAHEIFELILMPDFFRDLNPIPHSQEVIKELSESYEIFIATAAMEVPTSFTAKYEWLKEHFGFLNEMNFVFCGDKSIIRADYLIDDNTRHFKGFEGQSILFTANHNKNETGYVRVNDWLEVRDYFKGLAR